MAEEEKKEEAPKEEKKEDKPSEKKGVPWIGILLLFGVIVAIIMWTVLRSSTDSGAPTPLLNNRADETTTTEGEAAGEEVMEEGEEGSTEEGDVMDEEATEDDDEALIKTAMAAKLGKEEDEIDFSVSENTGTHAKGNVKDVGSETGGGYWLAAKGDDGWVIVYDGQANPTCEQIAPYDFQADMVPECLDENGDVVER